MPWVPVVRLLYVDIDTLPHRARINYLSARAMIGRDFGMPQVEGRHVAREAGGVGDCVLQHDHEVVVGDRETDSIEHFSPLKKRLQYLGSWVVRQAADTGVPDTTSGFRAYNREAAIQLVVVSKFTYTLETIIQAGKQLVAITDVPIKTNPKTRESRLFPSMWSYVRRNMVSIGRIYAQYEPLRVFMGLGLLLTALAAVPFIRFLVAYIGGDGAGHVQSLIVGAVLFPEFTDLGIGRLDPGRFQSRDQLGAFGARV